MGFNSGFKGLKGHSGKKFLILYVTLQAKITKEQRNKGKTREIEEKIK